MELQRGKGHTEFTEFCLVPSDPHLLIHPPNTMRILKRSGEEVDGERPNTITHVTCFCAHIAALVVVLRGRAHAFAAASCLR